MWEIVFRGCFLWYLNSGKCYSLWSTFLFQYFPLFVSFQFNVMDFFFFITLCLSWVSGWSKGRKEAEMEMEKSFPTIIYLLTLSDAPTQWDLAACRDIVMWPECYSTWTAGENKDIQAIGTLPSRRIDVTSGRCGQAGSGWHMWDRTSGCYPSPYLSPIPVDTHDLRIRTLRPSLSLFPSPQLLSRTMM